MNPVLFVGRAGRRKICHVCSGAFLIRLGTLDKILFIHDNSLIFIFLFNFSLASKLMTDLFQGRPLFVSNHC